MLQRLDHRTGESRMINVWPVDNMGAGAEAAKYRFQWNYPIFFSPHNPKRLYAAGNHLFVTENEGRSWEQLSPDLTTNDKSKQASSGGPVTQDNTSVEYYCTIFTAAESPYEKDLLWTGSDDGLIHISKDGGKNWENVTPKDVPPHMMWNCIDADPFKKGTAYFAGTRYKSDDFRPYLYMTEDYGKTWKQISNGIPALHFTRAIRADKKRPGLLYAGTEFGMYISYDAGANWRSFQLNLPVTPITDLHIKNNDLVVATQGRSLWILDDLSVVQQAKEEILNKSLQVFNVNPAYRTPGGGRGRRGGGGDVQNAGMNPASGVVINYYLKDAVDSTKLSVAILDRNNKLIKTFSTTSKENKIEVKKGMNQFVWDMNHPEAERVEGLILWNGFVRGPKAAPGDYTARFRSGTDSADVKFTILGDPNYATTNADYEEQVNFLLAVRDKFSATMKAMKQIRDIRQQLTDISGRVGKAIPRELKEKMDTIHKQLTAVEEALHQTKAKSGQDVLNFPIRLDDKIAGVYNAASAGNTAPSKQAKEAFADLAAQTDVQLDKLKYVVDEELKKLNQLIHEVKLPVVSPKREVD